MKSARLSLLSLFFAARALASDPSAIATRENPPASGPPQLHPIADLARPEPEGLKFTLHEAEQYALHNHPQIFSAQLTAEAVRQQIREARAGFFPQIYAELNAVYAPEGTRLAALNGINNPSIYSRQSDGLMLSQLITDFGQTYELTESARSRFHAASDRSRVARDWVVLAVDRAYFDVRRAKAILEVARDTVKVRQFSYDQIAVLFKNQLKSSLDASFAKVDLDQAQLLLVSSQNDYEESEARLSTALGLPNAEHFSLAEESLDMSDPGQPERLIFTAFDQRPELSALKNDEAAAKRLAQAQRAAQYPKVSALAYGGVNPVYDQKGLQQTYYAAGLNVEVPLANGGKLDAKADEAALLDQAEQQKIIDLQNTIARDVRVVLLSLNTARKKLSITQDMVTSADEALQLAQARYRLGSSSIVELTQAELNDTEAKLQAASARYDYQITRRLLDFTLGKQP